MNTNYQETLIPSDALIIDCTTELSEFRSVISELDMPPVDMEAVLEQVFEAVNNSFTFNEAIANTAMYMGNGEGIFQGLFENSEAELQRDTQQRIVLAVVYLGRAIKNNLTRLNAYRSGRFPYTFRNYINDRTILLSPTISSDTHRT